MLIRLSATSGYTTTFLQTPTIAKVHSIFAKTINLTIFNQILALQPQNAYLSPLSLLTFYSEQELNQLIQQFNLKKDSIIELQFDLKNCQIYHSELAKMPFNSALCQQYLQQVEQMLKGSNKNGLRPLILYQQAEDFIFQAMGQILQQAQQNFIESNWQGMSQQLAKLIGLGIGLTPSGDDFLCGVLAVLQKFALQNTALFQHLQWQIQQNLSQTNEISAAFLRCALQNHFSQPVIDFWQENSRQNSTAVLAQFEQIGHSSGVDTLCGMYFMLKLLGTSACIFK